MLSEQFDEAVKVGYDRLKRFTASYVSNYEVHNPTDVLHNALLWFRVKKLSTFEWRSQEEWESIILKRIIWDIANYRKGQESALDFKVDPKVWPESMDEQRDPLDRMELTDAFVEALSGLDVTERQVVLGVLAGFTQTQIGDILALDQRRVSEIWLQALQIARGHISTGSSYESR